MHIFGDVLLHCKQGLHTSCIHWGTPTASHCSQACSLQVRLVWLKASWTAGLQARWGRRYLNLGMLVDEV